MYVTDQDDFCNMVIAGNFRGSPRELLEKIHIVEAIGRRFKDNDKNNEMEYYTKVPKNKEARYIIMSDLCRECVLYMMEQTKLKCKNNPENLLYPSFRSGKRRSASSMETLFFRQCVITFFSYIFINSLVNPISLIFSVAICIIILIIMW